LKTAAVSELKASISEYLVKVKAGEELLVTDRGKLIARLIPLDRVETDVPVRHRYSQKLPRRDIFALHLPVLSESSLP